MEVPPDIKPSSAIRWSLQRGERQFCSVIAIPIDRLKYAAEAQRLGMGVGVHVPKSYDVSNLPALVSSWQGMLQRGVREGAFILTIDEEHPQVQEFIALKREHPRLSHCGFTVLLSSAALLPAIAEAMHACGDPSVTFVKRMPTSYLSPCGQLSLVEWQSVPLAHIDLSVMHRDGDFDDARFAKAVERGVGFLDACLDEQVFFNDQHRDATLGSRDLGLGVVGFAELLEELNIPYGSQECLHLIERIGSLLPTATRNLTAISPTSLASDDLTPNIQSGHEVSCHEQLLVSQAWQRHIDTGIAQTFVFPESSDIRTIEQLLEKNVLKGLAVYRTGSL